MIPGTLVYWLGATGVDTTVGKVIACPAIDPDGFAHHGLAEIRWADGAFDLCTLDEIEEIPNPTPEQIAVVAEF
ncbi:hypothetical protein NONI108955_01155 [Nocardia ninae]|uniref:Uncharacterized protein n=1 Tax=Nocardia ninae NBRC 108245 TaxID=1210091 RepID=A0A511MDF3_9NOCA|nr:hypothetical protein [Nocardia ninae]GEM38187.1 hypothetical protein NN4_27060 [Nocardia ninae NBRC 108245]